MKDARIIELDKNVSNKLSAGQLITSSFAVVKELIENSIDSHASNIKLNIASDFASIIVQDNGVGINSNSRTLIGKPNCTSKIINFDDLYSSNTFGFRGEALHHIITSSDRVEIVTRTKNEDVGTMIIFRRGERFGMPRPAAATTGTRIKIQGLFSNTPVRLKYLKRKSDLEFENINQFLLAISFLYPKIRLISQRPFLQKFPANDISSLISALYGSQFLSHLIPISSHVNHFKFTGLWPNPVLQNDCIDVTRGRKNDRMFIYITNRWISLKKIEKIVLSKFRSAFKAFGDKFDVRKRYPFFIMNIKYCDNNLSVFDPNVSPDKREIFIKNDVYNELEHAIVEALTKSIRDNTEYKDFSFLSNGTATLSSIPINVEQVQSCVEMKQQLKLSKLSNKTQPISQVPSQLPMSQVPSQLPMSQVPSQLQVSQSQIPSSWSEHVTQLAPNNVNTLPMSDKDGIGKSLSYDVTPPTQIVNSVIQSQIPFESQTQLEINLKRQLEKKSKIQTDKDSETMSEKDSETMSEKDSEITSEMLSQMDSVGNNIIQKQIIDQLESELKPTEQYAIDRFHLDNNNSNETKTKENHNDDYKIDNNIEINSKNKIIPNDSRNQLNTLVCNKSQTNNLKESKNNPNNNQNVIKNVYNHIGNDICSKTRMNNDKKQVTINSSKSNYNEKVSFHFADDSMRSIEFETSSVTSMPKSLNSTNSALKSKLRRDKSEILNVFNQKSKKKRRLRKITNDKIIMDYAPYMFPTAYDQSQIHSDQSSTIDDIRVIGKVSGHFFVVNNDKDIYALSSRRLCELLMLNRVCNEKENTVSLDEPLNKKELDALDDNHYAFLEQLCNNLNNNEFLQASIEFLNHCGFYFNISGEITHVPMNEEITQSDLCELVKYLYHLYITNGDITDFVKSNYVLKRIERMVNSRNGTVTIEELIEWLHINASAFNQLKCPHNKEIVKLMNTNDLI